MLPLLAYSGAAHIYIGTVLLTLALFGARAPVFALNGFSSADGLGTLARVAFGTSVLASFPLIFFTMRNWFVTQATKHVPILGNVKSMTVVLLSLIGLAATRCNDIGLVGSIAGGVFGSSMMFIFPPLIYIATLLRRSKDEKNRKLPVGTIAVNAILLVLGSCLGAFGTYNSIMSSLKR